jgi:predicted RNA-binding protein YlqC (UPF0109 family)
VSEDEGATAQQDEGTTAEEVLLYLIAQIVEHPDQVELEIEETGTKLSLLAKVSDEDIGRVIGKRGRVAKAIRTLVRAAATKDGVEVEVEFSD